MEILTFLVHIWHAVCACTLLVLLVVCACSLFFNAAPLPEKSSQRVLIVLDSSLSLRWMRVGS